MHSKLKVLRHYDMKHETKEVAKPFGDTRDGISLNRYLKKKTEGAG